MYHTHMENRLTALEQSSNKKTCVMRIEWEGVSGAGVLQNIKGFQCYMGVACWLYLLHWPVSLSTIAFIMLPHNCLIICLSFLLHCRFYDGRDHNCLVYHCIAGDKHSTWSMSSLQKQICKRRNKGKKGRKLVELKDYTKIKNESW